MIIPNLAKARRCLRRIGFQRLSGYWSVFQYSDGSDRRDHFRPGTNFETIIRRYEFDRHLRLLLLDAIERIEVAARATISSVMCKKYGPYWIQDEKCFVKRYDHKGFMRFVRHAIRTLPVDSYKQTDSIDSYMQEYGEARLLPSSIVLEALPFGSISKIFANLLEAVKKEIASDFRLPRHQFQSWLHAISHLRNLCAHHSRIWNRTFGIFPSVDKSERHHVRNPRRVYNPMVAIQTLLRMITGDNRWAEDLMALLAEYSDIPLHLMGFPPGWEKMGVWCGSEKTESA